MDRPTRSGKDQKKKRTNTLNKIFNRLKIRKLGVQNKRGRQVSTKKTGLSNIPVQERSAPVNKKARGLSTLGKDYKKQEKKLSEAAKKSTPTKNDTKNKKRSGTKTPAGMVRVKGGRLVSTRTAQGKAAMNRLKAKKRAQEMAKKRK